MATQAGEVAAGTAPGLVEQLHKLVERFGLIAAGLVALAGSITTFWTENQPEHRWAVLGLAAAALSFIAFAKLVMPAVEARRRRRIIALSEAAFRTPTTFRLRPYDEADHAGYERPDHAHHEALRWVETTTEPFLYLTGDSGTGKSSLLQAWLVPELAAARPPTRAIVVRSYADPIGQLTEALTRPGAIWDKRPPSTDAPGALLERAVDRVRPGRLLIVIDQFEECLILQDEAGRARLGDLFCDLRSKPLPGLTFLLALRDDYLDFDQLRTLGLPEVRSDGNWFKLKALSRGDAREILDRRLKIDEALREQVLDEASEVDGLPGLVRPITLNMLGLVLQRFRGGALKDTAPGRLIQDYLRQAMARPGIDQVAPRLLEAMITDKSTKRPIDEPSLAAETGTSQGFVRKALCMLAEDGVVRELEPERKVWEISHDFVARQLGQIIPRLRPSLWRRAQAKLAPSALVAWLVLLPVLAFAGPEIMERLAFNALAHEGVRTPWSDEAKAYEIDFGTAKQGAFERVHDWLRWVRPIYTVQLANDPTLMNIAPLYDVIEPGELTQLEISNNSGLQALPAWDGLDQLTQLQISDNSGLQALPAWDGLEKLEALRLEGAFLPAALAEVAKLPALRRLMLPSGFEGAKLARPADLPPVEVRFAQPGSREWQEWDEG